MNQNNISFEAVIKGLEACSLAGTKEDCVGYGCPYLIYNDEVSDDCQMQMFSDAYVLLKAQEPHLITKADFADNPMIDDDGYLPAWVEFNREKYGEFFEEGADGWGCVNINKVGNDMARYWTAKPSLKQMEETPWE